MAWARVRKEEIVEIYDQIPSGMITINGRQYDNSIFRNAKALAELGILEIQNAPKPSGVRYNITKTNTVFNPLTGKVERSYETVERPVDHAKAILLAKVKPAYEAKLEAGFEYLGNKYDVNDKSVMFIDIESRAAEDPVIAAAWPANYGWRDFDNQIIPMTAQQLVDFSRAARIYRLGLQQAKWNHEAQIAALTTHNEIENYDLSF